MVETVNAGVVNEPVVPEPPPLVDEHEVLFVEVQLSVVVSPLATVLGVAVNVTTGTGVGVGKIQAVLAELRTWGAVQLGALGVSHTRPPDAGLMQLE